MENLKQKIELLYSQMLDLNNRYSQEIINFFKANSVDEKRIKINIDGYYNFQISVQNSEDKNWANISVNYCDRKGENVAFSVNWSGCGMTSVDDINAQNYMKVIFALMFNNNMLYYHLKVYVEKYKELENEIQLLSSQLQQIETQKIIAENILKISNFKIQYFNMKDGNIMIIKRKQYHRNYVSILIVNKITDNSIFFIESSMDLDFLDKENINRVLEVSRTRKIKLQDFVCNELDGYDVFVI